MKSKQSIPSSSGNKTGWSINSGHSSTPPAVFQTIFCKAYTNARNFVFPPLCIVCSEPVAETSRWFCSECLVKLEENNSGRDACPHCSQNLNVRSCTCDIVWDNPFERVFSLFDFDKVVQCIAHNIKYRGKSRLAFDIARVFACKIPSDFAADADIIIPIPLHPFRKMKRGYNQAEFLARGFTHKRYNSHTLHTGLLTRTRHTKSQTRLDKEQRRTNLKGAFKVPAKKSDALKNKNVILVDDVVTTGATTGYCAEVLLKAGAASVRVLSLARD
ncbi:MAG: hypothetical protein GF350_15945 [Chitinivibrionales bacterium]|nr:hypothetical protein [Chitinivibrionales bacterium]